MNNQEIYDKVKAHLIAQGKESMNDDMCAYRGKDGTKCAIGCLIKDEFYDPTMEGLPSWSPTVKATLIKSIGVHDLNFLGSLQDIHDRASPDAWRTELELLAIANGLTP